VEAYNLYLQGHYYANKYTPQSLNEATEYFNQAIRLDPEFAHAYAGLARCYALLANAAYLPAMDSYPKAKAYAIRALEIDDTLAEAHTMLAAILFRFDWDWAGAERAFKKAMKLSPDDSYSSVLYATLLSALGRYDEALAEATRAQELDPVFLSSQQGVGIALFIARRYDEAIEQFNKAVAMDPNFPIYIWLALTYIEKGMVQEALAAADKYAALTGSGMAVAIQGYIYARAGRRSAAQKIAKQLIAHSKQRFVPATMIAQIYSGLGETDLALEWLEKAYEQRDPQMFRIKIIPSIDPLRSHPRFTAILKKMGLVE